MSSECDVPSLPRPTAAARDGLYRWLALGCVYAAAVAFAIAASPAVGVITLASPQMARQTADAQPLTTALGPIAAAAR